MTPGRSASTEGSIPLREPTLYALLMTALMVPMDVPLISPAVPEIRGAFAISDAHAGLVITVFTVPGIVLAPVIGLLADRYGRVRLLTLCLLVYGVAGASIGFASTFSAVLVLRFVQGCVAVGPIVLVITLIGDYYAGTQRNSVMGLNSASLSFGDTVYPAIGGALAVLAWYGPFLAYSMSIFVAVIAFVVLEEPEKESTSTGLSYVSRVLSAVSSRRGVGLFGAILFNFVLLFGVIYTVLPFMLANTYALDPLSIGILLTAALSIAIVVASLNGTFARYISGSVLIVLGFVSYGASFVGIWLAGSPLTVGLALVLSGVGYGLVVPSVDSEITDLVAVDTRAGVVSIRASLVRIGQTLGPALVTTLVTIYSYSNLVVAVGVGTFAVVILAVLVSMR